MQNLPTDPVLLGGIVIAIIWEFAWKGVALWRAAKNDQKNWFIAFIILLPVNTLGILEIVYLFVFCKKPLRVKQIRSWLS